MSRWLFYSTVPRCRGTTATPTVLPQPPRPPPSALRPPPSALRPPPSSLLPVIEHAASATTEQRSANCHHRVDVSVIISFASGVKVATVASSTAAEANAFEKEA